METDVPTRFYSDIDEKKEPCRQIIIHVQNSDELVQTTAGTTDIIKKKSQLLTIATGHEKKTTN